MKVFQTTGEGVLTVCLDDGETVHLNFKNKVEVSVKSSIQVQTDHDGEKSGNLQSESSFHGEDNKESEKTKLLLSNDSLDKADPLDEELNGFIERAKKGDNRDRDVIFAKAADELFSVNVKSVSLEKSSPQTDSRWTRDDIDNDRGSVKKFADGVIKVKDDMNEEDVDVRKEKNLGKHNFNGGFDVTEENIDDEMESIKSGTDDEKNDTVGEKGTKESSTMANQGKSSISSVQNVKGQDKIVTRRTSPRIAKEKAASAIATAGEALEEESEFSNKEKGTLKTSSTPAVKPKGKRIVTMYRCNLCGKTFNDNYTLSVHQRAENTKALCKICNLECMSKANLIVHDHLMHAKGGKFNSRQCPICNKQFQKHSDILMHIRIKHTNEGLYRCCVCPTMFQDFQSFRLHLTSHSVKRRREPGNSLAVETRTLSTANIKKMRMSTDSTAIQTPSQPPQQEASSSSRRKSKTPMQLKSLLNYPSPKPPSNPPSKPQVKPSPHQSGMRSSSGKQMTPVVKLTSSKPVSSTLKARPQVTSVRTPLVSATTESEPLQKGKLKLLVTPSLLQNRKGSLNELPVKVKPSPLKLKVNHAAVAQARIQHQQALVHRRALLAAKRKKSMTTDKLWKCHFCERVFRSKGDYINHKKPSRIVQTCRQCGFTSTSKALYLIHEYQKHTHRNNDRYVAANENIKCHMCEEPVKLNEVLVHVMSKHTGEHPYECCVCKHPSATYEHWVSHGKSHMRSKEEQSNLTTKKLILNLTVKTDDGERDNQLFCNLCKGYHANEFDFIRHHRNETKKRECELCKMMCYTDAGYMIHKFISHGIFPQENTVGDLPSTSEGGLLKVWHEDDTLHDNDTENTRCPSCFEMFPMKDLISHVMTLHTQELPYKCCACKALLPNLDQYIDHCNFHLGRKLYSRGTQRCLVCGLRFESRIRLSRHKLMHKPSCNYCQTEFKSKALLEVHLKNYHMNDMTPCGFCGKLYADPNQLAEHERNHYFFKKAPCPDCGLMVNNVTKHMARKHAQSDKQYLCNLCGQKFPVRSDLSRHLSRHSTDRRFECDMCNKTFKRASGLRRHAQSHLRDRKYHECPVCGKKCTQRNNLSVHMRVHALTKAFTCEHCGQGFNYNQSLQSHIKKKHMNESNSEKLSSSSTTTTTTTTTAATIRAKAEPIQSDTSALDISANNPTTALNINMITGFHQDQSVYPPDPSQVYYSNPTGFVNASFQRTYTDLIQNMVRSEHDQQQTVHQQQQQTYQIFYPQF